jgi:pimeloyl-ACP methyl ester carboxylesterase
VAQAVREEALIFRGYIIKYRVSGSGPALVLLKPHRLRKTGMYELGYLLAERFTVLEIEPLGYAYSDRPGRWYPIHEQVEAVVDREGVREFVVWGYSRGGWMALATARCSRRVLGVVAGGCAPLDAPTEAQLRRYPPGEDKEFWLWYRGFDWLFELGAMKFPRLVYVGSEDGPRVRGPRGIPRTRDLLVGVGVSVLVFDGLDHLTCHNGAALSALVVPTVLDWLDSTTT